MASGLEALGGTLLFFALLPLLLAVLATVALWRIGTGTQQTAAAVLMVAKALNQSADPTATLMASSDDTSPAAAADTSLRSSATAAPRGPMPSSQRWAIGLTIVVVFLAMSWLFGPLRQVFWAWLWS